MSVADITKLDGLNCSQADSPCWTVEKRPADPDYAAGAWKGRELMEVEVCFYAEMFMRLGVGWRGLPDPVPSNPGFGQA